MPSIPEPVWIIGIKRARRKHITFSDSLDQPMAITLCGKDYDPADRFDARKTKTVSGSECLKCLKLAGHIDTEKTFEEFASRFLDASLGGGGTVDGALARLKMLRREEFR